MWALGQHEDEVMRAEIQTDMHQGETDTGRGRPGDQ